MIPSSPLHHDDANHSSTFYPKIANDYSKLVRDHVQLNRPRDYQYVESRSMRVSRYTLDKSECGKDPDDKGFGITASGIYIIEGTLAADHSIEFGTIMKVEDLGWCIVLDRGGAIEGSKIDAYCNNRSDAFAWGVRTKNVAIYKKPEDIVLSESIEIFKELRNQSPIE